MQIHPLDKNVLCYQETGDSELLVQQFDNYIKKYVSVITGEGFDLSSYDIRCFIAFFIKDRESRKKLRRGKYHDSETLALARKTIDYLKFKLRRHEKEEVYRELLVPFLECAAQYKQMGIGFEKYLYKTYKFYLKKHLDNEVQLDVIDQHGVVYYDQFKDRIDMLEEIMKENEIEMEPILDADMELTSPRWISGKSCGEAFTELKPHERYILSKYYFEGKTDIEIARMLPYNPKSIHRIRMRMKKKYKEMYNQGELKWIRI